MSNTSPTKQPPPKSSGKNVTCNVFFLDGENVEFSIDKNDNGRALFDKVCTRLDLIERDYFGLTYTDDRGPSHLKYWLNLDKKIAKQKKRGAWVFEFALKFYPPDPSQLRESLTRWLVVLQVRRDLLSGRIPCTSTTYAILGSYNVQADIGEYDPADHGNAYDYIKDMAFAPNQTPELLEKIAELHKQHKGQTPDEAEKGFLDNAKKLAMYGVDLHKAKDSENNAVMVGVCCSGLLIFRDKLRLNRFVWPKILKLSYKRNHFYIKIRPGEMERNDTTIMFKLDNHRLAKRLWKTCVEHHAFFRLREAEKPSNNVSFPRFGSKFRYSGRTLYQTRQTAALLDRPPPFFERSQPARNTMPDTGTRSRSMDDMGHHKKKGSYEDGMYDPDRDSKTLPNRYGDEKDKKDVKGVPTAYAKGGRDGDSHGAGDDKTIQRRPWDSDTADRKDRLPSQGGYDPATEAVTGVSPGSAPLEAGRQRRYNPYGPPYGKDGYNDDGYDKDGFDKDGYDKDGFDKDGYDRKGRKTPYGPPYGKDGFNPNGYDKDGYDKDGYDKDGYDRDDYDIKGRKKPYAGPYGKDGYNKNGYKPDGYDRDGYDKNAFDKNGNNKRGRKDPYGPPFGKDGFNDNGYNKHGLDRDGKDKDGYDKKDLDKYGRKNPYAPPYDQDGYNDNGFDKHGFDKDGYDKDGFDKDGFDKKGRKTPYGPPFGKDGFNENGYDKDGYDKDGYDKDGYDRNDNDIKGYKKPYAGPFGKDGYNKNGYRPDGYDRDGYDKNAFDKKGNNKRGKKNPYGPPFGKDGFNDNGYNKHGLDRDGKDKDGYDKKDLDKYGRKNPYAPPYDQDGYNDNGFDKHGFDKDGYDKDGFDKDGFDKKGRKTPYGPPYGKDGFNENGYDKDGYDKDGFDKDGYDRNDNDIKGYKKPYAGPFGKDGYNKNGYRPDGYDRDGYDKNAFDKKGNNKRGKKNPYGPPFGKDGFNDNGYNKHGLDRDGKDKDGYDKKDLDKYGRKNPYAPPYDKDGYNDNGFDKHGFDRDGYDKDGFNKDGYDRNGRQNPYGPPYGKDGYNKNGYDKNGFDRDGYDKDGYDRDGFDRNGKKNPYGPPYGKDGYNKNGYDKDGFDKHGYDKDGFDRKGYDKDGFDRDGKDKHGKPRKDKKGGIFSRIKKGSKGDSDAEESPRGKTGEKDKNNILGSASGLPYGVGLGVGKGDMTGVVGEEKSVDNKLRFIPIPAPPKGTKDSLKPESTMPFFHPAATSTVGRPKVPPPVLPRGSQALDDSFNYKAKTGVYSGDEEDDYDFDAALTDAIRCVTEFNPDMSVERIECVQQIEDVKNGK
ncbi:hypothetical protein BsWGS_02203 [Bradybaena similaris]